MQLSDFDFEYPENLIATHPLSDRDASRMMVLGRKDGSIVHSAVREFPKFLKKGDVVVVNDTKVFPARLVGKKQSGGMVEILLLKRTPSPMGGGQGRGGLRCITNQTARLKIGTKITFPEGLVASVVAREGEELVVEFNKPELIEQVGLPPLPPYIRAARAACHCERGERAKQSLDDHTRYQTVYASKQGSSAAPTAGLHFTDRLLGEIKSCGVDIVPVTLHVGLDTFRPVREEDITRHRMHGEEYFIPGGTIEAIRATKESGGRVVAIGTTTVRALESDGMSFPRRRESPVQPWDPRFRGDDKPRGDDKITDIFIYPGYKFKVVDAMLTNFHQPKSTLIMMVSAFAGRENILRAYKEAVAKGYRLFSYGDCMFIS
jgi:S-adenosylmethionine:tRNA ribosyltransferase-isomerase